MKKLSICTILGLLSVNSAFAEDYSNIVVTPAELDRLTILNDFSPKQSQNLEPIKEDLWRDTQIVLINKKNGKYEYKFRFAKFHRQHRRYYIAKHTPYLVVIGKYNQEGDWLEYYGMTDENGFSQSVFLDFELKAGDDWQFGDTVAIMREFVDVVNGYASNVPVTNKKDTGVYHVLAMHIYKNNRVPVLMRFRCSHKKEDQYFFGMTTDVGDTQSLFTKGCKGQIYYIVDKKHGQDAYRHTYKK